MRIMAARHNALTAIACATLFVQAGCVTAVQPIGAWSRPLDLELKADSLKGTRVSVRCGRIEKDAQIRERNASICRYLGETLKEIGAELVPVNSDGRAVELTVWYLDQPEFESQSSGVAGWAFFASGGLTPEISTASSHAELRITDSRGVVLSKAPLELVEIKAFGWLALTSFLTQKRTPKTRQAELERNFLRFVQNQVYSQSLRRRIARGEEI